MYYCDFFDIYINMNQPHENMCLPILNTTQTPLLPHASGFFHSTGVGCIFHALNLHWSSLLYMVMYLFQCYVL